MKDKNETIGMGDAAEHMERAKHMESAEHMERAENMELAEHMERADHMERAGHMESAEHMERADHMESAEHMERSDHMKSPEHMERAENIESAGYMEWAEHMESAEHMEPAEHIELAEHIGGLTESIEPKEAINLTENTESVKIDEKQRLKKARAVCSRLGFSLAAFLGVTFFSEMFILFMVSMILTIIGIRPTAILNVNAVTILSTIAMYGLGFPVSYLILKGIRKGNVIEKRKWTFGQLLAAFIICVGALYAGNIIGQLLMFLVKLLTGKTPVNGIEALISNLNPLLIFVFMVLVAPVVEELLFRKALIDRTIRYGEGVSLVLSGVLFGLAHGNFYQFFYACALGIIFAYVYMKSGKIQYTIIFHMIINFMGSVLPLGILKLMEKQQLIGTMVTLMYGALIVGCMIAGVVLFAVYWKRYTLEPGEEEIPKGKRFKTMFINIGMITYLVVCVVMFAMG